MTSPTRETHYLVANFQTRSLAERFAIEMASRFGRGNEADWLARYVVIKTQLETGILSDRVVFGLYLDHLFLDSQPSMARGWVYGIGCAVELMTDELMCGVFDLPYGHDWPVPFQDTNHPIPA